MFEYWSWFLIPFLLFIFTGYLIYLIGRRAPKKPEPRKENPYTCGEPVPASSVRSDNFYQDIIKIFRLEKIREAHSGNVSDYLLWILVGLAALVVLMFWL